MRNRTYGGVRGRKVSLPCGKLTFLLLDLAAIATRSSEQREALQTLQTASEAMRYTFLSKDIAINATSQHSQHIFE